MITPPSDSYDTTPIYINSIRSDAMAKLTIILLRLGRTVTIYKTDRSPWRRKV